MQWIVETVTKHPVCTGGIISAGILILLWKLRRKPKRVCGVDYPKNTVIVHQFGKGIAAPSLGHFVVKLETYLRVAKIPYEPNYKTLPGPKGKWPWIEYNGKSLADSQMIISFLNKEFGVDLNKGLSPRERAQAWAIQKWLEEFTYWLNVYTRWVLLADDFWRDYMTVFPRWMKPFATRKMNSMCYTVGVGRHSREEVADMMRHDLQMLSDLLGDKKFLMGDEPADVDCMAFSMLAQILCHTPDACPGRQLLKEKLSNLVEFFDRIKERYWPDWNDRITRPQL